MTFVKTGFAPNDRLSLEVKKRNGPACSGEAFLTLMAPILPAAPRSACGPPCGSSGTQREALRGRSAASQPGPGTRCLATHRQ